MPLHPLLDTYNVIGSSHYFTKLLTGKEFYLNDHQINGIPVLPGVVYLEMARAAGTISFPKQHVKNLSAIIWATPIQVISQAQEVRITLIPRAQGISFEIITLTEFEKKPLLHARGKLIYDSLNMPGFDENFDMMGIKSRCTIRLEREVIYRHFESLHLNYGPNFQVIEKLMRSDNEVISTIKLPNYLEKNADEFYLHPNILDGAFQTVLALLVDLKKDQQVYMPFSLDRIELFKPLTRSCIVIGRLNVESKTTNSPKFEIQIIDESGNAFANIRNFSVRAMQKTV